jgi:bzd-type benzoyl-CoA reductase N subunit
MVQGLAKVEQIYRDRGQRAKELKAEGRKVIGYLCSLTPVEVITAVDFVPYRIMGNMKQSITHADAYLETIACPFTRSCLDIALKGSYDFLDGFIMPHACDNIVKLYDIWAYNIKHGYAHFINVPHTLSPASFEFFEAELETFKRSLERFSGREITTEKLTRSIQLHNEQRALVRKLYQLRKQDPPLLSGTEMTKVIVAVMSTPVTEANELLRGVIKEVKERGKGCQRKSARLMVCGTGNDDVTFIEMVEESGANVVIDDLCFGTRPYWYEVELSHHPLASIARSYLEKINCPRTYRQSPGSHQEDLENRFGYLYEFAKDFKVNGVILYVLRYCDTHALDAPDVKEYLVGKGLPVLEIEGDYPTPSTIRLKTRVQAFLEMIS